MYVKSTYLKRQIQATRKQLWKSPSDAFRAIQSLKFEKKNAVYSTLSSTYVRPRTEEYNERTASREYRVLRR